ncbi:MAG: lysoplasmalogenase [Pirellulaceae bacterium]|nr:lysoplasmalogenase [Pirellulaceae bacterium]
MTSTHTTSNDRIPLAWLGLWAVLLGGGLVAARTLADPQGATLGTVGRLGSSIVLVTMGVVAWKQVSPSNQRYALLIAIGMFLGTIGDFFNANQLKFVPLKDPTLGAIIAFGIGHIVYMSGLLMLLNRHMPLRPKALVGSVLFWQLFALAGWYVVVYQAPQDSPLMWPALGYTLLLAGTAGLATAAACHQPPLWPLALGAALFLISDLILAVGLFRGSFPYRSEAVWLTYGPGQMLIVVSTWLVDRWRK